MSLRTCYANEFLIKELGVSGKFGVSVSGAIAVLGVSPMSKWRSPKLSKPDIGFWILDYVLMDTLRYWMQGFWIIYSKQTHPLSKVHASVVKSSRIRCQNLNFVGQTVPISFK